MMIIIIIDSGLLLCLSADNMYVCFKYKLGFSVKFRKCNWENIFGKLF